MPSTLIPQTSDEPSEAKDYIYRYWGTAWAAIGLSGTLSEVGILARENSRSRTTEMVD